MKSIQVKLKSENDMNAALTQLASHQPNLIFAFGAVEFFKNDMIKKIGQQFPKAQIVGCSTAGEIGDSGVTDNTLIVTACTFRAPEFASASAPVKSMIESKEAGRALASQFKRDRLTALFILGRGLNINGSAVIEGIREIVGDEVTLTGGLAGDGGKFQQTFTLLGSDVSDDKIVALAIYGDGIKVAFGSMGGWEPFGPVRKVTKSKENVLYELDGKPALEIYKTYLGDKAKDLPASGLLYPFAMLKDNQSTTGLIRTILAVNEADQSLTLAGDMPANGLVRLMHTNNDGLVKGARGAAETTSGKLKNKLASGVGVLISCVGRKLVMGTDIEDELDAIRDVFGQVALTGFYSYGEICPQEGFAECKLHNQTMTMSYFYETEK